MRYPTPLFLSKASVGPVALQYFPMLAMCLSTQHFRYLLEDRDFCVNVDHKPLVRTFSPGLVRYWPREVRHLDYISRLTTDIRYVCGVDNTGADALSHPEVKMLLRKLAASEQADPCLRDVFFITQPPGLATALLP